MRPEEFLSREKGHSVDREVIDSRIARDQTHDVQGVVRTGDLDSFHDQLTDCREVRPDRVGIFIRTILQFAVTDVNRFVESPLVG